MRSLPSWQFPFLGVRHFPRSLTHIEIKTFFSFTEKERAAIRTRRGDELRLAFGIHLGFLKMTGTTLNALDRIPIVVLAQVSTELNLPTIDIATVRSLYRKRQRTLYNHQQWVMQLLNIDIFDIRRQRALIRAFASSSTNTTDVRPITVDIMCWLYTRGIRIPGSRRIQELALKVTRRSENELASSVETQVPNEVREWWAQELFSIHTATQTNLQWLASSPKGRSASTLEDAIEKLRFLRLHSVPFYSLPSLSVDNLVKHAHRCRSRRASTVKSINISTRDLEVACFLRHSLLVATDTILSLCDLRTTDLRRHARDKANTFERTELHAVRELLSLTCRFAADNNHSNAEVRQYVLSNLSHHDGKSVSRAQRYREALCADGIRIRQLRRRMITPHLECVNGSKIESLLKLLKNRQRPKQLPLSDEQIDAVPDRWRLQVT